MNANPNRPLRSLTAVALLALGTTLPSHAADCSAPGSIGERRACAAAAEGIAPLRHFVERTRTVYGLRMQDFTSGLPVDQLVKNEDNQTVVTDKDSVKVAKIAEAK